MVVTFIHDHLPSHGTNRSLPLVRNAAGALDLFELATPRIDNVTTPLCY